LTGFINHTSECTEAQRKIVVSFYYLFLQLTDKGQKFKIKIYPAGVLVFYDIHRGRDILERRAVIDPKKCDKSPGCPARISCPANAIEREDSDDPYFVNSYCQGCAQCVQYCPGQAIKMV